MNKYLFILLLVWMGGSCTSHSEDRATKKEVRNSAMQQAENQSLIYEGENGEYREWYPGRKQLKIEGRTNDNGDRVGIWKSYFENGSEQSVVVYENGLKEGIYIVRFPNNLIRYRGEYLHDEPIGIWKFYDEEGNLIEEKDYSKE
ncbi:MAG: hypothetical protein H3C31_03660 [Brumimicrobium sp.]|nr:hypothetical protein [Brumimicrobium sp.]MCO5267656.1 hypothetical protein [Brumimicrobium sp.]